VPDGKENMFRRMTLGLSQIPRQVFNILGPMLGNYLLGKNNQAKIF